MYSNLKIDECHTELQVAPSPAAAKHLVRICTNLESVKARQNRLYLLKTLISPVLGISKGVKRVCVVGKHLFMRDALSLMYIGHKEKTSVHLYSILAIVSLQHANVHVVNGDFHKAVITSECSDYRFLRGSGCNIGTVLLLFCPVLEFCTNCEMMRHILHVGMHLMGPACRSIPHRTRLKGLGSLLSLTLAIRKYQVSKALSIKKATAIAGAAHSTHTLMMVAHEGWFACS